MEGLELIANTASKGVTDKEGNQYTFNAEKGKWEIKAPATSSPQKKDEPLEARLNSEEREAVMNAMRITEREKGKLIEKLTSHLTANTKTSLQAKLEKKSLEELQDLLQLQPTNNRKANRPDDDEEGGDDEEGEDYSGRQGNGFLSFNQRNNTKEMKTLSQDEASDVLDEFYVDYTEAAK